MNTDEHRFRAVIRGQKQLNHQPRKRWGERPREPRSSGRDNRCQAFIRGISSHGDGPAHSALPFFLSFLACIWLETGQWIQKNGIL